MRNGLAPRPEKHPLSQKTRPLPSFWSEMLVELILQNRGLGINLRATLGFRGAFVDSFYRGGADEALDAEKSGLISIGDILISIGSINVDEETIETIQLLLKRSPRPLTLIFLRAVTIKPKLLEVAGSPLNRLWVKKYLRDNRLYFQDQEEWGCFAKLNEIQLALDAFAADSTALHTVTEQAQRMIAPYVDLPLSTANLSKTIAEYLDILLRRGVERILESFLASDVCKRMQAYYYRSPTFELVPLTHILSSDALCFYLYLFLSRHNRQAAPSLLR